MSTSSVSPLAPAPAAVPVGMAGVHAAITEVAGHDVGPVTGHDVAEVDRAISRLEGIKLRMVAAADRQGVGRAAGMSSTSAWLAASTRAWGAKAAADVSLATALDTTLPATRAALADGSLSTAHAVVIAGTARRLPTTLSEAERAKVEAALVAQARWVDPARLRRSARRALAAAERSAEETLRHEDTELRGEESRAESRVRLTLHDNQDGTVTGHFTVPSVAGAILRKTIQQMVSPRRRATGDTAASPDSRGPLDQRGAAGPGGASFTGGAATGSAAMSRGSTAAMGAGAPWGDIDWAHRQGQAFVELLEHLPTDRLSGKVAATVVVTIEHDRLLEGLGAAHLDTGHDLSASEARRLACSAGILPAVLDGSSLPLDLGRTHRFFSEAQRVALATTYDECAAQSCDRPFAWTEVHHEEPWASGGATDLRLAVPLCGFHHRRSHDPTYEHHVHTDATGRKTVTFHQIG